jgi:hypothetical protein
MSEASAYRKGWEDAMRNFAWRQDQKHLDIGALGRGETVPWYVGKDHGAESTTLDAALAAIPNLWNYDKTYVEAA